MDLKNSPHMRARKCLLKESSSTYTDNKDRLCIAAEGKTSELDFLIKDLHLDVLPLPYEDAVQVSEYALKAEKYENLLTLLIHDFPFPKDFGSYNIQEKAADCSPTTIEKLQDIQRDRQNFYDAINDGNKNNVEEFVKKYPNIKIGYLNDRPALNIALDKAIAAKNFKIYAFLRCYRFTANDDDIYLNSLKLSDEDKRLIMNECSSFYDRRVDSHIFFILSKIRLGFQYEKDIQKKYIDKIMYFLDELNKIPEIVPILKVIEYSRSLMIVFDFDRLSSDKIDLESSDKGTLGICYFIRGHLYIGAKGGDEEIMGTLIHELCHYAMEILYSNNCKPFYVNHPDELIFKDIVREYSEEYRKCVHKEKIIGRVFSCYPNESHCAELIVRVPEIMIFYSKKETQLDEIKSTYHRLFSYYNSNVISKIEERLKDSHRFQWICDVQNANESLGYLQDIQKFNIKPITMVSQSTTFQVILSNVSQFTVTHLIQRSKSQIAFALKCLEVDRNQRMITSTYLQSNEIELVIDCEDLAVITEKMLKIFESITLPGKVFFVCEKQSLADMIIEKLNHLGHSSISKDTVQHKWSDLPFEMQTELLETQVEFQKCKIKLNKIIDPKSDLADSLPLAELVKGRFNKIGKAIPVNDGYKKYIERTFYNDEHCRLAKDTKDLIAQSEGEKIVLLEDNAGMGKSTSLTHIANKLKENKKDFWIFRIDLRQQVNALRERNMEVLDMIIKYFGNITDPFEEKLLRELYARGKVILLLDGVDEILPELEHDFDNVRSRLLESRVQQIWFTLRPYIQATLENKFDNLEWKLKPFTKNNYIDFIVEDWRSYLEQKVTDDVQQKLFTLAKDLISLLQNAIADNSTHLTGIPLQAKMVAQIFFKEVENILNPESKINDFSITENFNLLWLYEQFIRSQIKRSLKKGPIVENGIAQDLFDSTDIMGMHEKLAIDNVKAASAHKLQPYGIISFNSRNEYYFIHFTYREYFVARFVSRAFSESKIDLIPKALFFLKESRRSAIVLQLIDEFLKKSKEPNADVYKAVLDENQADDYNSPDQMYLHFSNSKYRNLMNFWLRCQNYSNLKSIFTSYHDIYSSYSYFSSRILIEHIWKAAENSMNDRELKKMILDSNIFICIFLNLMKSETDIVDELLSINDIQQKRTLKCDDITYEYYEANSTLTMIHKKVKKILDKNEQQKLLHLEHGSVDRVLSDTNYQPAHSGCGKKFLKYFLKLRWKIYKEMSPIGVSDVDLMSPEKFSRFSPEKFSRFLTFYLRLLDCDNCLVEIYEWIDENFNSKEIMLQCIQVLYESFPRIEKEETFYKIWEIIKRYLSCDEFFTNLPRHSDIFDLFTKGCPLRLLKMMSKILAKEELLKFMKNSYHRYHSVLQLSHKYAFQLDTLSEIIERCTNKEIYLLYKEEHEIRIWIVLLLLLFSVENRDIIIPFIASRCSEELQRALIHLCALGLKSRSINCSIDRNRNHFFNLIGHIYNMGGAINSDVFFIYFPREKLTEVVTLTLRIRIRGNTKVLKLDAETTILDTCKIFRDTYSDAIQGEPSEYGLYLTRRKMWLQHDRMLRYYDLSYDLFVHSLEYKQKLHTLFVDISNGEIKHILVDISQPVSKLILAFCTEIGISNHEQYCLKSIKRLDNNKTLLEQDVDVGKTLLLRQKSFY